MNCIKPAVGFCLFTVDYDIIKKVITETENIMCLFGWQLVAAASFDVCKMHLKIQFKAGEASRQEG